ncbi:MAG: phosphotransferase [Deltaproteobacteria bacterium]|jgi:phosphate uptake regulator/aminoglycoside phosphotransferase (APT) family kinase protein|nr:phosphotransferase [Deltaproteobacteria bacterium]
MKGDDLEVFLKLLTTEVFQSATDARDLLFRRDPSKSRSLFNRVTYISNQVAQLQKQAMEKAMRNGPNRESLYLQGLSSVASRLERISDLLLNLDRQAGYLTRISVLYPYNLDEFFKEILFGLEKIFPAFVQRDVGLAVKLGQVEEKLDSCYANRFARLIKEFGTGSSADDLVTVIMIVHYLERIGDIFLEIGEKIIYISMGEKIKLEQYKALGEGLKATGESMEPASLDFRSIWGGRSGCRIGVIGHHDQNGEHSDQSDQTVVFKHGPASKMTRERDNLALWEEIRPGLTPKVKAFIPAEAGNEAALIMEFVNSRNLQALLLDNASDEATQGIKAAFKAMFTLWRETKIEKEVSSTFCRQTEDRLREATTLYPRLMRHQGSVGNWKLQSVAEVLAQAKAMEESLKVPFTARIHGDFNLSNLLFNPDNQKLTFVDIYRSRETDYLQDVSVMLVSIVRLPVTTYQSRLRLYQVARMAESMVRAFAKEENDETYKARLAFGLARSFVTSTRFVLDDRLAEQMVSRARYLWEKIISHRSKNLGWADFNFSLEILEIYVD